MLVVDRLVGMTEEDAVQLIESHQMLSRVVCRDGEYLIVTMEIRTDRVDLTITDGVITAANVG